MDLKPVPIAAAVLGGGALAYLAGTAPVQKINAFAPAGVAGIIGLGALAMAPPGNGAAVKALGFASLGIAAALGIAGFAQWNLQKGATQQAAGASIPSTLNPGSGGLANIVGYWLSQNVAPPQVGGHTPWARSQLENDMTGRRQPAAWGGAARP